MSKKIDVNWSREKLDAFLQDNYGHGISEFRVSIFFSYTLYYFSDAIRIQRYYSKRIKEITQLENKIISLIDDDLNKIGFYENTAESPLFEQVTGISKWTTNDRKNFIEKYFKLGDLINIFEQQKNLYCRIMSQLEIDGVFHGVETSIGPKPIKLLILTWANAMRRNKAISWINMSRLISWFSKNLENQRLKDFFFNSPEAYTPETLKMNYHRYRKSYYDEISAYNYRMIFLLETHKNQYQKIEKNIERHYLRGADPAKSTTDQYTDGIVSLAALGIFKEIDILYKSK